MSDDGDENDIVITPHSTEYVPMDQLKDPTDHTVYFCYSYNNMNSCVEFEITIDGAVKNKVGLIESIIATYGEWVELNDGSIVNLTQFVQAFVTVKGKSVKPRKPNNVLRIVK